MAASSFPRSSPASLTETLPTPYLLCSGPSFSTVISAIYNLISTAPIRVSGSSAVSVQYTCVDCSSSIHPPSLTVLQAVVPSNPPTLMPSSLANPVSCSSQLLEIASAARYNTIALGIVEPRFMMPERLSVGFQTVLDGRTRTCVSSI